MAKPRRQAAPKRPDFEPVRIRITPFGIFATYKGGEVGSQKWGKDPAKCAANWLNKDDLAKELSSKTNIKAKREFESIFGDELEAFALKKGFNKDEFRSFLQQFMVELTKLKLKAGLSKDKLTSQAQLMTDDLNKIINMFYERLAEWYGLYYPESIRPVKSVEEFAKIVGEPRETVSKKLSVPEKSMGIDLEDSDLMPIRTTGEELRSLLALKEKVESYIESEMSGFAPNLAKIAGPVLGAKLIQIAGSLEKLAKLPASTVQILGAEKALFRHLRKGTKPPKHGVILQHQFMKRVAPKNRGKVARTLASKISIAAKVDFYSKGKDLVWERINKELEERVKKLK
jgi:nucleolar protein 56